MSDEAIILQRREEIRERKRREAGMRWTLSQQVSRATEKADFVTRMSTLYNASGDNR